MIEGITRQDLGRRGDVLEQVPDQVASSTMLVLQILANLAPLLGKILYLLLDRRLPLKNSRLGILFFS